MDQLEQQRNRNKLLNVLDGITIDHHQTSQVTTNKTATTTNLMHERNNRGLNPLLFTPRRWKICALEFISFQVKMRALVYPQQHLLWLSSHQCPASATNRMRETHEMNDKYIPSPTNLTCVLESLCHFISRFLQCRVQTVRMNESWLHHSWDQIWLIHGFTVQKKQMDMMC